MVEYGGGINQGPAGQVGGGGGGGGSRPDLGSDVDVFGSLSRVIDDTSSFLLAQPLEVLVAGFFVVLLGLVVLKRAF